MTGDSLNKWPIVGRAYRWATLPNTLACALVFLLVVLAGRAATYLLAVPGLASESLLMQRPQAEGVVPEDASATPGGTGAASGDYGRRRGRRRS